MFVVLVSSLAAPHQVHAAACAAGVTTLEVSSSSDVQSLRAALNCTGGAVIDVAWHGAVAVSDTFYVPDGSNLTVTGFSSGSALDGGSGPTATIDGGHRTPSGFFRLYNNSVLSLSNLVLDGGYSTSHGGAVGAYDEDIAPPGAIVNIVDVVDCTFYNNTAEASGESGVARILAMPSVGSYDGGTTSSSSASITI